MEAVEMLQGAYDFYVHLWPDILDRKVDNLKMTVNKRSVP
ncbi:hypothetical protein SAMN03159341_109205 [Paenibacillus sp. 1_12]|nr:hypothetical protein SAMN03159341_109205 [Paenibacillus sp. 1_12]